MRVPTLLLVPILLGSTCGLLAAPNLSDRLMMLEDYHGYYPCMDCHSDQETNHSPRILLDEHEIPLEWEDDDGNVHLVEFGELLPLKELIDGGDARGLRRKNLVRIGDRLNIQDWMSENDMVETDSVWTLTHGGANLWCLDCHSADNRDQLTKLNGEKLSFNESHLLCGQCHGPELRDWEYGVHGKTTGYWNQSMDEEGLSVKLLCVECHIPHAPHFRGMMPKPAPVPRLDNISHPEHAAPHSDSHIGDRDNLGPHSWDRGAENKEHTH